MKQTETSMAGPLRRYALRLMALILATLPVNAEVIEVEVDNLTTPDYPAFTILGVNPEVAVQPGSLVGLGATVLNSTEQLTSVPNNLALEFNLGRLFDGNYDYSRVMATGDDKVADRVSLSFATTTDSTLIYGTGIAGAAGMRFALLRGEIPVEQWDQLDKRLDAINDLRRAIVEKKVKAPGLVTLFDKINKWTKPALRQFRKEKMFNSENIAQIEEFIYKLESSGIDANNNRVLYLLKKLQSNKSIQDLDELQDSLDIEYDKRDKILSDQIETYLKDPGKLKTWLVQVVGLSGADAEDIAQEFAPPEKVSLKRTGPVWQLAAAISGDLADSLAFSRVRRYGFWTTFTKEQSDKINLLFAGRWIHDLLPGEDAMNHFDAGMNAAFTYGDTFNASLQLALRMTQQSDRWLSRTYQLVGSLGYKFVENQVLSYKYGRDFTVDGKTTVITQINFAMSIGSAFDYDKEQRTE